MIKSYLKNILRDIRNTKGKVIAIATMVGLAAMVIVALTMTGATMRNTLNNSLHTYDHPDIIVSSSYGLDYEDKEILKRDTDIDKISFIKSADLLDNENLIRVKAYNKDITKSVITKGHMPKNKNEIVLDKILEDKYKIGDKISFSYIDNPKFDEEVMNNLDYEVVGFFKTSDYFMEDMRELSYTAKKELNGYAYVLDENFDLDSYGEVNIIYKDTKNLDKTSKSYKKIVEDKKENIEEKISNRPQEVLKKAKTDANKDLDNAQDEINEAKDDLSEGEKELEKARNNLDKGYIDYENGKKTYNYEISKAKIDLANTKNELTTGQNKVDKGWQEYRTNLDKYNIEMKQGQNELNSKENELSASQKELDKAQNNLNIAYKKLEDEFLDPRTELSLEKIKLDESKKVLDQKSEQIAYLENKTDQIDTSKLEIMKKEFDQYLSQYQSSLAEYNKKNDQIEYQYNLKKSEIDQKQTKINNKKAELNQGWISFNQGKSQMEDQKNNNWSKLESAKNELKQKQEEINQGWAKYDAGLKELENKKVSGKKELEESYSKLLDGEEEYKKNLKKFDDQKADGLDQINKGENEVEENRQAILKLKSPEYEIETIFDNKGINTYYQNSLNIDELTKVFPTFFYLVAMLVTISTMKRYIDEQRNINATLKALGYTNKQISQRFYLYGIIPTLVGSIIGSLLGRFLVTGIIINAYSSGFGSLGIDYINSLAYIIFAVILSVSLVALTVHLSSKETVKETPAALLRPKAPQVGKKILLERIKVVWSKLSFMQKITARNLFRYKSRMLMTLFGVGGCTALTFFGFAMIDSIKDTVNWQQNDINHYDIIAMVDDKSSYEELKNYKDRIKDYDSLDIRYDDSKISINGKDRKVSLVIPKSNDNLNNFVSLRNLDRESINIANEKAVISEKASNLLGIDKGDEIKFTYDNKNYTIPITNIAENYTGDFIYISKQSFEKVTGKDPIFNANYLKGDANKIIKNIENEKAVNAIINASITYASMDVLLDNLNLVIGIITIISILLALVVLYNLININVSERKRELATIKVLGFYPKEVTSYIFKEIFILTILGIFVGFGLGYAMFRYIIYVVAPSDILLSYRVHFNSFLFSGLITLAISVVLLFIVHKNLRKIDMAEAMSSGE